MSQLLMRQWEFSRKVVALLRFAHDHGYEVTFGDAYRDPRVFGELGEVKGYGEANSFHKKRLAIDINLFRDGKFLGATKDHELLGRYWESMGGTWGGRFKRPDGNHYSLGE